MEVKDRINGTTKLVALIGSPVANSGSPEIHNAVFESLGCNYAYVALDVPEDKLETAVRGMEALGFVGYNVTAPYKTRIVAYMDEISPAAQIMGSVNTVAILDGRSLGDNADGAAFMRNLVHHGVNVRGRTMTVLGAGGAASAIVVQAALDGVARIRMFNRRDEHFERGLQLIERLSGHGACEVTLSDLDDKQALGQAIAESALLVNATNVGTQGVPGCLVPAEMLTPSTMVAEMVYVPRETELLRRARERGCTVLDGVGVFLQQAAIAERLWFGIDMPVSAIRERFF